MNHRWFQSGCVFRVVGSGRGVVVFPRSWLLLFFRSGTARRKASLQVLAPAPRHKEGEPRKKIWTGLETENSRWNFRRPCHEGKAASQRAFRDEHCRQGSAAVAARLGQGGGSSHGGVAGLKSGHYKRFGTGASLQSGPRLRAC